MCRIDVWQPVSSRFRPFHVLIAGEVEKHKPDVNAIVLEETQVGEAVGVLIVTLEPVRFQFYVSRYLTSYIRY